MTFENAHRLLKGKQKVFSVIESGIFLIKKQTQGKRHPLDLALLVSLSLIEMQTPKKILQRLPRISAQVKAGNTYENLINEMD